MNATDARLPIVSLTRTQWVRMVVVGLLVVIALSRVVPDFARLVYPLHVFGYRTDGDGVVAFALPLVPAKPPTQLKVTWRGLHVPKLARVPKAAATPVPGDRVMVGDRIRIDRIEPYDRKPGIALRGYTYDNPTRYLPVERAGHERVLKLASRDESFTIRYLDMLRIPLFVVAVGLGAILFLVKPSIATAGFFFFCLSAVAAPATFFDLLIPNPWRPIPQILTDVLHGFVTPALLLFALCMIDGDADAPRERIFAWFAGVLAIALGALNAYAGWRANYGALPAQSLYHALAAAETVIIVMTGLAFAVAFARARHNDRHRIGWIVTAFAFAGVANFASDRLYPGHIPLWFNSLLVSTAIVPIVVVWIAVIRHQFFNVDFVVSRAVVYVALTAAVIGTISVCEEIGTYLFYQNTDLAYGVLIAISMGVGSMTGKIKQVLDRLVDRFIFRDRSEQRKALEFIAGYILDAETVDDVYRALLQDAAHALKLSFGGILARQPDGSYVLGPSFDWPEGFTLQLGPSDELTRAVTRTRGALTFSGRDTRMIQDSFPNERLTFVAPLFYDRAVSGIVVYGHNVSGLDLDPEERELLVRVVAHASIALNAIELAKYREETSPNGAASESPTLPEASAPLPGTG